MKGKNKAYLALLGGGLIVLGLYLTPWYIFQELFVEYLSDGRGYYGGIILATLIGGMLALGGMCLVKPNIVTSLSKPWVVAALGSMVVISVLLYFGGF